MHIHYRPSAEVLDHIEKVNFVGVVGPTAVGKTTLIEAAAQHDSSLRKVTFTTSRPPRPGEHNGVDYHFLTREEMEERIGRSEYVNVAPIVLGDLYASAPEDYTTAGVAVAAILAEAVQTFRGLPFATYRTIFVVPPDWETWQKRIQAHGFTKEQLQKRLAEAKRSLEFADQDYQTMFVINNELSQATDDFIVLARNKAMSHQLQADQTTARAIARDLIAKISQQR